MASQESSSTPGSFPTLDSLLFPSAQTSISQTLASLRRSALSVSNRLLSIETDAKFVREVGEHYGLPLVANERCGSWYIDPETKGGSAYFKSTDGHTGQWDFSFRRLNLQLLSLARDNGGSVLFLLFCLMVINVLLWLSDVWPCFGINGLAFIHSHSDHHFCVIS